MYVPSRATYFCTRQVRECLNVSVCVRKRSSRTSKSDQSFLTSGDASCVRVRPKYQVCERRARTLTVERFPNTHDDGIHAVREVCPEKPESASTALCGGLCVGRVVWTCARSAAVLSGRVYVWQNRVHCGWLTCVCVWRLLGTYWLDEAEHVYYVIWYFPSRFELADVPNSAQRRD